MAQLSRDFTIERRPEKPTTGVMVGLQKGVRTSMTSSKTGVLEGAKCGH
jgi:hypothetical protein